MELKTCGIDRADKIEKFCTVNHVLMTNSLAKKAGTSAASEENGLLLASGLITGETLMAIFIAVPIFITGSKDWWPAFPGYDFLGIFSFLAIIYWIYNTAIKK